MRSMLLERGCGMPEQAEQCVVQANSDSAEDHRLAPRLRRARGMSRHYPASARHARAEHHSQVNPCAPVSHIIRRAGGTPLLSLSLCRGNLTNQIGIKSWVGSGGAFVLRDGLPSQRLLPKQRVPMMTAGPRNGAPTFAWAELIGLEPRPAADHARGCVVGFVLRRCRGAPPGRAASWKAGTGA